MPLPVTEVERELRHTRRTRFEGYKRADGLWDIEGHITDVKSHDNAMKTGVRRAGQPIHEMWIRLTIDRHLNILAAAASSDGVKVAAPIFWTTQPPAQLANTALSSTEPAAARPNVNVAVTVSPAPVTSTASR